MRKYIISIILILLSCVSAKGYNYPVSDIPDSSKVDAVSVVRDYTTVFSQSNVNNGTYNVTKATTILNKQGDMHANFVFGGDKFREISKFSGIIRDASGNVIRKIKKGDLIHSSIDTESLATDSYTMSYDCKSPAYPFTVEYTYEIEFKNGIISYPPFFPINYFRQSIMNASYTLKLPLDTELRHKSNISEEINESKNDKNVTYSVATKGIKAISNEFFSPSSDELLPLILFAPSNFCFDSACGSMTTWESYGLWVNSLLKDRDILPSELVSKLKDITSEAKDEREKIKIIYEYLQNNTRYVSIQLGIGGLQPFKAAEVAKTKFSDCKGLSNLMKAMLQAIDIPSNYCEISMDNKNKTLYPNFANVNQTNHVILLVPLKNDSIWLECTSQTLPFGFIHNSIAGHDALVITKDGGKICRLPSYPNEKQKTETNLLINIKEDGSINGELKVVEHLDNALRVAVQATAERKKQMDYIYGVIKLPRMQVGDISIINEESLEPSTRVKITFEASDFINQTGSRLFIPICPLYKGNFKIFSSNTREHDIDIISNFLEYDTISYKFPDGYSIESLPKDINIETQFGSMKIQTEKKDGYMLYTQRLQLKSGRYNKSGYKELKDFFTQIDSALKRKFVLRKD